MTFTNYSYLVRHEVRHICHQGVHMDEPECKARDQHGGDAFGQHERAVNCKYKI